MLQEAEDNYYISAKYLLELTNRAYELFKSSEVGKRRQLIKLVPHNLRLEGKIVRYDGLKPFDTILNYADNQLRLARWDDFRQINWVSELEFPELTLQQTQQPLAI